MSWLEITGVVVAVLAFMLCLGLGTAAKRGDDHGPLDDDDWGRP